jgi:lipoprotein-anchoring transpeptidase ErfK/SrfK
MTLTNARVRVRSGAARAGIALSAALLTTACNQTAASMFDAANAPSIAPRDNTGNRVASDSDVPTASATTAAIDPKYLRQRVRYPTRQPPGTVVVDPDAKFLYLVMADGTALRYGIGVGREGFGWSGSAEVARKAQWPRWTPPPAMIRRQPGLERYRRGMEPGLGNPLGARALYLYQNGRDTLYRIHGTNEPWSIGQNVSSGCIRLLNEDVVDLFTRVPIGARVVVLPAGLSSQLTVGSAREPR